MVIVVSIIIIIVIIIVTIIVIIIIIIIIIIITVQQRLSVRDEKSCPISEGGSPFSKMCFYLLSNRDKDEDEHVDEDFPSKMYLCSNCTKEKGEEI